MVLTFFCFVVTDIIDFFQFLKQLMQKSYLFSVNKNAAGKCIKFYRIYGYSTFPTIGKPDIYLLKSLGKSATVFIRVTNNYQNWLPTYLIFSAIDTWLTNIRRLCIYRITNCQEECCIRIFYRFQMHLQAAILFAKEIGKFFALIASDLLNRITQ